ncbi:Cfr10I/Bse634I family restriction endonuclease [Vibrio breoganii]|uniref:Cfr10I/Bse634I family restriction endonuclease n=1 Tax=Vibrio breoganii TaxID=553239 RepID=UPI0023EF4FB7|nr:Cfr10I/Bse634I family restriction endonuclease [Vibrio breoganii]
MVGCFSIKTSLRPDCHLQTAHEGSLTRAVYVHLQIRSWFMYRSSDLSNNELGRPSN